MVCKKCGNMIDETDLFCRFCGERQMANENMWNRNRYSIAEDYSEILPKVISDEYYRIFSLLDEGQSYGAVLQLKDVYEVSLKIPVIFALAYICDKGELTEVEHQVFNAVIARELSSGTWHSIVRMMLDCVEQKELLKLLQEADELWSWDNSKGVRGKRKAINDYTSFPQWRNATIGHGALAFDNDASYLNQFDEMIFKLNSYLENVKLAFSSVLFDEEANTIAIDNHIINLSPFVVITKRGTFLFDSYLYGKKKYDILNYNTAEKASYRQETKEEQELEKLYNMSRRYIENVILQSDVANGVASLYGDWHTIQDERLLDDTQKGKDYVKIPYLTKWVQNAVEKEKIFVIAMQSGLGKTSWSRTFDNRYVENSDSIYGFDVKVVYINRFYNKTEDSILTSLQDTLSLSSLGQIKIKLDNPRYINREAEDKKKEVGEFIQYYYQKMHEAGEWKEKGLLLIFDGLDEIHEGDILQWIPNEKMLGENIKILFTARYNKAFDVLKREVEHKVGIELCSSNMLCISNSDTENREILKSYIEHISVHDRLALSKADEAMLLERANYNFLNLYGLLQLTKMNGASFPKDNYYQEMLIQLRGMYSEKFFEGIRDTIGIFAVIPAPLTIKEIAQILGYESPGYLLASYLKDLQAFLSVEYRGGDAFYSLTHNDVMDAIKEADWFDESYYLRLIKNCIMDSAEQLTKIEREYLLNLKYDNFLGAIYILRYAHLLPKNFKTMFSDEEFQKILIAWADVCSWVVDINIYQNLSNEVRHSVYNNIYILCKELFEDKSYMVFESFLRMSLLNPEYIAYHRYTQDDFNYDVSLQKLLVESLLALEEKKMSVNELNIYERELLIYPVFAGRVALKGIINGKNEAKFKNKERLAHALRLAIEIFEDIEDNPRYSTYDKNILNGAIREMATSAQTLVEKKVLNQYKVGNLKSLILNFPVDEYQYGDIYKESILLNIETAKYINNKLKIPAKLLQDADCLYDSIIDQLKSNNDAKANYCLVSYLPAVTSAYMLSICANGNTIYSGYLSGRREELLNRVINIYELYDRYGFTSHEFQFYINALVTVGVVAYNVKNTNKAVGYLKTAIKKYEYYLMQPYYHEKDEVLFDVCNANYTLCMYYALEGNDNIAMKHLKIAQKIYRSNVSVRKMFASEPAICAQLRGKSAENISIKKLKIGRNDPCSCGSGKKYKKCCGK